jgi:uncharacterized membrane protein YidH (DUF202 family)
MINHKTLQKMKHVIKISGTILIIVAVGLKFILSIAIAGSSHKISIIDRENSIDTAKIALVVGLILIIAIWLPWKSMVNQTKVKR